MVQAATPSNDSLASSFREKKLILAGEHRVKAPKRISHLQFGTLSPSEMCRTAEFQVTSRDLYTLPGRRPAVSGCLDPRLGVSDKASTCATCRLKLADCAGHFGYIQLALPVFHIGFLRHTIHILQCICKSCSSVLLSDADKGKALQRMRNPRTDVLAKSGLFKATIDRCKKVRFCSRCGAANGTVKKLAASSGAGSGGGGGGGGGGSPAIKIVHDRSALVGGIRGRTSRTAKAAATAAAHAGSASPRGAHHLLLDLGLDREIDDDWHDDIQPGQLERAAAINPAVDAAKMSALAVEDLLPTKVLQLFERITDSDCEVLWMDPSCTRPENMILQNLLVPPVPIRPSVAMDVGGGSNEDDLTVKLQEILDVNVALQLALSKGPMTRTILEEWDFLQVQVAQYIHGELPGLQRPMGSQYAKPMRGLCQRLKGKQGRFRGNLSGKRVDFSARTVISPDPNLAVDQVGVPRRIATLMTYPERVNRYNVEKLRERVRNGPDVHPGANLIRLQDGGFVKSLAFGNREQSARQLRYGDVVERHMEDDDIVLFNRQPSLHKVSIMAHRVKVMEWRTFRFNTCVCAPYNADFDGDEMNLHYLQTEEAKAEAKLLMGVKQNLVTPRNGEPLVAASQDFLTASYMLTQRDQFFTWEQFCQLVTYYANAEEHIDVPHPAIVKPVRLWTGKQVFSLLLTPNRESKTIVNFETKEKNYTRDQHFCRNDGWVAFRNSELISGNIAKKSIGDGSKSGLLYTLLRDCGPDAAAASMDRWAKFCGRYLGAHRGLSIGISDVTPSDRLQSIKHGILSEGYRRATANIDLYDRGELELRPGCDMLQSLEEILNGILGRLREAAGQEAMKELPWNNSPRQMADCGSKGSPLNISQMVACVGQQAVGGMRIQNGFVDRTLPHFEPHSLTPSAKGFVANSFYSGLTATEFFFHAMGGREGLVDTAVKTAETGYMARRLMKALEDLSLQYDSSVRNSENTVVQFVYGDDGLSPDKMESNDRPVDFDRLRLHVSQTDPCPEEQTLEGNELMARVRAALAENRFVAIGQVLRDEIQRYFEGLVAKQLDLPFAGEGSIQTADADRRGWNSCRITSTQLERIMEGVLDKCLKAFVEPGEAVGAIGAQSISEPGTQMTLKTFHFSGISSMNVTLGVPRLKEIINAAKMISTPIITAKLESDDNKIAARIVKAGIEKTTLGEISLYIKEVFAPGSCYISITLDMDTIEVLKLNVDSVSVRNSILSGKMANGGSRGLARSALINQLEPMDVKLRRGSKSKLRVYVPTNTKGAGKYFAMQQLKAALPSVIVQGIPSIERAVISESDRGETKYNLLMEGYGLLDVMGCPGIDGLKTYTNHILEVEQVLGVEAARTQISAEIEHIMNAYGIGIDARHLLLLADVMTFKGEILGITRFGVSKMRESVLMLASFEKTTDHLFDAAVHGRTDAIVGVSECIIMGMEVPVGTGLPSLFWKSTL